MILFDEVKEVVSRLVNYIGTQERISILKLRTGEIREQPRVPKVTSNVKVDLLIRGPKGACCANIRTSGQTDI